MKLGQKKVFWLTLSFIFPVSVAAISYLRMGIYPTSELTILTSDGFGQLANFYAGFNNMLHGKQSFFYTWSGSIGLNFVALMSYYINSIFSFLVYFFDNAHMADAMYVIFLTKIGAMGASFWWYSDYTYRIPQWMKMLLSTCYALVSFTMAYSIFLMWMDALIYLPLILLGIQKLMDQSKPTLLFVSYFLLFISNYYMAFMVGLFSFMYFTASFLRDIKKYKKTIFPYLTTSFLAGGASMITILPSILDLKLNGEKFNSIEGLFTGLGPWDMVVKNMPGVYDTSKYGSAPFIYIGLLPLIFCTFYFVSKKIQLKNKLIFGGLCLVMILSFHIDALNLFWHGFHSPYMFLFRYSYLLSVLILLLAGFGLEKFEKSDLNLLINSILVLAGLFFAAIIFSNKKRYDYISAETSIVTFGLLAIYIALFVFRYGSKRYVWLVPFLLTASVYYELSFNTHQLFLGLNKEWGYYTRKNYSQDSKDIEKLVEKTKDNEQSFYRMENQKPLTRTDSFNYDYSGITMFSSIRNRNSSQYLNALGFKSRDTNLNIQYTNNTLPMDSLLGIKYNLSLEKLNKFGFDKIASSGKYNLYENRYALPLGILTDKEIFKEEINKNQTMLIQHLSDSKEQLYQYTEPKEIARSNLETKEANNLVYYSEKTMDDTPSITWEVQVPKKTQAYIIIDPAGSAGMTEAIVKLSVKGQKQGGRILDNGIYFDLGYYDTAQKIDVTMEFSGQSAIRLISPSILLLDTERFQNAVEAMKEKAVVFKTDGNKATTKVSLEKEQVIYTTIPYDQGWSATIDGKRWNVDSVSEAMIALTVPKGEHQIILSYYPKGIKLGSLLFVICTLLFSFFVYRTHRNLQSEEGNK